MYENLLSLIGITLDSYHLDDNVVFIVCSFIVLYCLGFMFNFFQTLMERATAKKR